MRDLTGCIELGDTNTYSLTPLGTGADSLNQKDFKGISSAAGSLRAMIPTFPVTGPLIDGSAAVPPV